MKSIFQELQSLPRTWPAFFEAWFHRGEVSFEAAVVFAGFFSALRQVSPYSSFEHCVHCASRYYEFYSEVLAWDGVCETHKRTSLSCSILPLLDKTSEENLKKKMNHGNLYLNCGKKNQIIYCTMAPVCIVFVHVLYVFACALTAIMLSVWSLVKTNAVSIYYPSPFFHNSRCYWKPLQTNPSFPQCLSPP